MKKNLILLHGALGSKAQFQVLEKLLAERFNVYTLNFSGHGGSNPEKDFSMDLFSENVSEFMVEKEINAAHFFGYSMGGYVALNFAKKHPGKVHKIITLATKFNWTKEAAERETKMLDPNLILQKVPHFAASLQSIHGEYWKKVLQSTAQMMVDLGSGKCLKEEDFNQIHHEVLICVGDNDKMVSISESEDKGKLLPHGKLKIAEGFPHPIEKVDQEQLASIITEYI